MWKKMTYNLNNHKVVSESEWIEARKELLKKEKELTILRDQLSQQRRDLPWVQVNKEYVFEGPNGKQTLSELFDGRSQLIVYHLMYDPTWDAACQACSFWADNFNDIIVHLNQRDVTMIAISKAPYSIPISITILTIIIVIKAINYRFCNRSFANWYKIDKYKQRMGWDFMWISSFDTNFNRDYYVSFTSEELEKKEGFYNFTIQDPSVSELPGVSVFYKDPTCKIFHTYSAYSRGMDILNNTYNYLDLVPKGRDEDDYEFPMAWVSRHDEYNNK